MVEYREAIVGRADGAAGLNLGRLLVKWTKEQMNKGITKDKDDQ